MRRTEKPADRTLRVWNDGHDVTDCDPAAWPWPYSEWWAAGWRPAEGPNSTAPGLIEGGRRALRSHSSADFTRSSTDTRTADTPAAT